MIGILHRENTGRHRPYVMATLLFLTALAFLVALQPPASAQEKRVSIRVVVPSSTPKDASVFITGNSPVIGSWDPGKTPMTKESDSIWTYAASVPANSLLEYKITRGSWDTEALYVDGTIPQNLTLRVASDTLITLRPVTWNDISPARRLRASKSIVGTLKYHRGLRGEGLKYDRDVIAWLPPSYEKEPQKRYPVLYMHDGQNVFDASTSFIGYEWRADEVADSLIKAAAIEEIIIVGIYNTPDRMAEYDNAPLGRNYARFVVEQLKPMIDSTYRTKPSRENTAVIGSSMGGLMSLLFVWWYPNVFSKAGCISTSIWRGNRDGILDEIRNYNGPKKDLRIYVDVGGLEDQLVSGFHALASLLEGKGYQQGKDLECFLDKVAVHNEIAWAHRLWHPLKFMFGK